MPSANNKPIVTESIPFASKFKLLLRHLLEAVSMDIYKEQINRTIGPSLWQPPLLNPQIGLAEFRGRKGN